MHSANVRETLGSISRQKTRSVRARSGMLISIWLVAVEAVSVLLGILLFTLPFPLFPAAGRGVDREALLQGRPHRLRQRVPGTPRRGDQLILPFGHRRIDGPPIRGFNRQLDLPWRDQIRPDSDAHAV